MPSESRYVSAPGTPLHTLRLLAADIEETRARFSAAPSQSAVEAAFLEQLLDSLRLLEQVCAGAAEMELGADGFDNTEHSRRYAAVQKQVLMAAQQIALACRALVT